MPELFSFLSEEHKKLTQQLKPLEAGDISEPDALTNIFDNLLFHMELEEAFLYPPLERLPEIKLWVENARKEQLAIRYLIKVLFQEELKSQKLQKRVEVFLDDAEVQDAITELFHGKPEAEKVQNRIVYLLEAVRLHLSKEEKELFPKAKQALSNQEQSKIQREMQRIKNSRRAEQIV